jgi:general secretion pathway protein G
MVSERRRRSAGWTVLEMMLVVAIFATLLAIALPQFREAVNRARIAKAIGDIEAIQMELAPFDVDENLPPTLEGVGRQTYDDPWGNPYQYLKFDDGGGGGGGGKGGGGAPAGARKDRFLVPINSTYDLYSMGEDGASKAPLTAAASKDDIVRANDGGFIGLASQY